MFSRISSSIKENPVVMAMERETVELSTIDQQSDWSPTGREPNGGCPSLTGAVSKSSFKLVEEDNMVCDEARVKLSFCDMLMGRREDNPSSPAIADLDVDVQISYWMALWSSHTKEGCKPHREKDVDGNTRPVGESATVNLEDKFGHWVQEPTRKARRNTVGKSSHISGSMWSSQFGVGSGKYDVLAYFKDEHMDHIISEVLIVENDNHMVD
ncbi:hypothetical protein V6N13_012832 [Hibiscus sabdariffa]